MDSNLHSQELPPAESYESHQSFDTNPPAWQDSASRPRGRSHYRGPYPTSNPRMRPPGNFQQRGRYSYNKRGGGGYRQQQEQASDTNAYQATTSNYTNRNFKGFFRATMLEDPWAHLQPLKVPANGTTLVFDSVNQ